MKKIIIPGWFIGENSFGVTKSYLDFLAQFGYVQILSPNTPIVLDADLLVLPGGRDVSTTRYNQYPSYMCGQPDQVLEYFDVVKLPEYIDANIPIFGICRGLQTLNVHFGGTLKQHLRYHPYSSKERTQLVHEVMPYSIYKQWEDRGWANRPSIKDKKNKIFEINSLHHQAVDELGDGLVVSLMSEDDEIEAIEHVEKKIHAVEWHPEEIYDTYSIKTIEKLLNPEHE